MKSILTFVVLLVFAAGCSNAGKDSKFSAFGVEFSVGTKMDLTTGAKTSYSGLAVENIYIVDAEDNQLGDNEVPLDSKFSIVYEGIENYTLKEGKAFPGLSIDVTDEAGNAILNEADLFSSYTEGFEPETAAVLRGTVIVGNPMQAGNTYLCKVRVFDKNSEAEIITEMNFKVK